MIKPFPTLLDPPRELTQIPRGGSMTIAAGFFYKGGILVCADSQFTSPSVKFHAPKLSSAESFGSKDVNMVFAMSGSHGYMQTAVAACERALYSIDEDKELDEDFVMATLEDALVSVYEKHFYKHPRYGYTDGPQVSLIAGVWTTDNKPVLFETEETTVKPIDNYACIGSGADIANQVLRPLAGDHDRSLKNTVLLATHALKAAKDSDPNCGGDSQFATINMRGWESPVARFTIESYEAYSAIYQQIQNDLFFASAEIENAGQCIAKAMENIKLRAGEIDMQQHRARENRNQLIKMLMPVESGG